MRYLTTIVFIVLMAFSHLTIFSQTNLFATETAETVNSARGTTTPIFTGPGSVCPPSAGTYSILNLPSGLSYTFNWQVSGGYIIAGPNLPQNSSAVTVFWTSTVANGSISVEVLTQFGVPIYTFNKTVYLQPNLPYDVTPGVICTGQTVIGNASIPGGTNYQWSFTPVNGSPANGLNIFSPTGATAVIEGVFPGQYNIYVNATYCSGPVSYGNQITVTETDCDSGGMYFNINPENLNPFGAQDAISVYPNPVGSGNTFTVSLPNTEEAVSFRLTSTTGQVVRDWQQLPNQQQINTHDLPPGIYLLQLEGNQLSAVKRVVISN